MESTWPQIIDYSTKSKRSTGQRNPSKHSDSNHEGIIIAKNLRGAGVGNQHIDSFK